MAIISQNRFGEAYEVLDKLAGGVLGEGTYGKVYKAKLRQSGETVAISASLLRGGWPEISPYWALKRLLIVRVGREHRPHVHAHLIAVLCSPYTERGRADGGTQAP